MNFISSKLKIFFSKNTVKLYNGKIDVIKYKIYLYYQICCLVIYQIYLWYQLYLSGWYTSDKELVSNISYSNNSEDKKIQF